MIRKLSNELVKIVYILIYGTLGRGNKKNRPLYAGMVWLKDCFFTWVLLAFITCLEVSHQQ